MSEPLTLDDYNVNILNTYSINDIISRGSKELIERVHKLYISTIGKYPVIDLKYIGNNIPALEYIVDHIAEFCIYDGSVVTLNKLYIWTYMSHYKITSWIDTMLQYGFNLTLYTISLPLIRHIVNHHQEQLEIDPVTNESFIRKK